MKIRYLLLSSILAGNAATSTEQAELVEPDDPAAARPYRPAEPAVRFAGPGRKLPRVKSGHLVLKDLKVGGEAPLPEPTFDTGINCFTYNGQKVYGSGTTMTDDAEALHLRFVQLMNALGAREKGQYAVIDISYPALYSYAKSRIQPGSSVERRIDDIKCARGEALVDLAMRDLFEADCAVTEFSELLLYIVQNPTGRQRICALLTLKVMLDHEIGNIGASFYKDRKIKIQLCTDAEIGSHYDIRDHAVKLYRDDHQSVVCSNGAQSMSAFENLASTLVHELSHTYHCMLGLTLLVKATDSMQFTLLSDPRLARRLCVLSDEKVFNSVKTRVEQELKGDIVPDFDAQGALTFAKRDLRQAYAWLVSHKYIVHNDNRNDLTTEVMNYMTVLFMFMWCNAEECLTISGVAPLTVRKNSGLVQRILITDRQNESTFRTRGFDKSRLLHARLSWLANPFKDQDISKAHRFVQILSDVIQELGAQQYLSQNEMQETADEEHNEQRRRYNEISESSGILSLTDALCSIRKILAAKDSTDHESIKSELGDNYKYALENGMEIGPYCLDEIARAGCLSVRVIDAYYRSPGTKMPVIDFLSSLTQVVASWERRNIASVFLEYSKNRPEIFDQLCDWAIDNGYIASVIKTIDDTKRSPLSAQTFVAGVLKDDGNDAYSIWQYAIKHRIDMSAQDLKAIADHFLEIDNPSIVRYVFEYALSTDKELDCTEAVLRCVQAEKHPGFYYFFINGHTCIDVQKCIDMFIANDNGKDLDSLLFGAKQGGCDPDGRLKTLAIEDCISGKKLICVFETFQEKGIEYPHPILDDLLRICVERCSEGYHYSAIEKAEKILKFAADHRVKLDEEGVVNPLYEAFKNSSWLQDAVNIAFAGYKVTSAAPLDMP